MKSNDEKLLKLDIPKPIVIGRNELTDEERKRNNESLNRLIDEFYKNAQKKDS
jgi:hypothetical protein